MFDLEHSISTWKSTLDDTRALSPDDIAELESHLRDSLDHLSSGPLSPEESFLLATRRIGHPASLIPDYSLAHPHRLWRERALWMLTGLLAYQLAVAVGSLADSLLLTAGAISGFPGLGFTAISVASTLVGCAASIFFLFVAWHRARAGRLVGSTQWVLAAVTFLLLQHLAGRFGMVAASRLLTPNDLGRAAVASAYVGLAWSVLVPVALGATLLHLRRGPTALTH